MPDELITQGLATHETKQPSSHYKTALNYFLISLFYLWWICNLLANKLIFSDS